MRSNIEISESKRGQSLVEFALIFPIFILVLVGLFDLGRAVYAYNTISNASRESVRVAIVNQTTTDVTDEALKQAVSLGLVPADVTITYSDPDGSGTPCSSPYSVGCLASVTVQYGYSPATPVIGQIIGPFTMTATTEMPVERTCPYPPDLATCPWP
jgi:Flp pilus assembly protein TadG